MAGSSSITGNECKTEIIKYTTFDKNNKEKYKFRCRKLDDAQNKITCSDGNILSKGDKQLLIDGTSVETHHCKDK